MKLVLLGMKEVGKVLPVRCKGCGSVFDLWKSFLQGKRTRFRRVLQRHDSGHEDGMCERCRALGVKSTEIEDFILVGS
jgi:DNA-directed RNA polymerase subunit N (RpoN/RPB10)